MHTYFLQFYLIYIVQASINRKSSWAMFRKCAISKEKNGIFVFFKRNSTWKKRKPWKINSSWRDCLFSFLFEFLPHCVRLKMIMKCKLFEILTRHLFQKEETLCIHSESHFVNERKTLTAFKGNAIIFHHRTIWIGCSLLFRNEFLFYRIFA